ncbi:hypothetical protein [Pseudomonas sp. ESBL1]
MLTTQIDWASVVPRSAAMVGKAVLAIAVSRLAMAMLSMIAMTAMSL